MGEVLKTNGDAKAAPAVILAAAEQKKKEEKNKARDARKKAAAEEKKKEKEEELKKQRKYQLQQVNSIRNKDHHNRQLPRLDHHVTHPVKKANVPTAPVACAKMVPLSGADASKKSDKAAATHFLVTQLETIPILKMAPISSADASEKIDINQPADPVISTGSEERSFFVGRILFRISSSSNQTKTNDQQTNENMRLEFGKDTDQINKDNNNASAATDVPSAGTTTVTSQLADELNMKEKQVVSDANTTMNRPKNSDDDDVKFEEARGKGLIRAEQNALNAEATERTENQAERKKTQAIRKEGYNKFSVLLEESENEEERDIDPRGAAEEAATATEEKPHESEKEQDMEARRAEEAATAKKKMEKRERKKKRKIVATSIEERPHESGSEVEQDMEARRAEEAATTAQKKREKRERQKKRKIVATATTIEEGKDIDQGTIMCSQINKDNNNAAAATDVPGTTTVTNQFADEFNMKEKQLVSDAKTNMNRAKNSNDDDDKFEEARGKGLIRAEKNALNAEAIERTEDQAQRKKTQAIRKEGYNKFSVLHEESENEEERDIDTRRAAEEAATTTEEKPHESEKEQDMEARRAEEVATAKKKREKRERKKKRKIVATTIEERSHESGSAAQSWSSVGVLSLALVCFLSLTAFYMS